MPIETRERIRALAIRHAGSIDPNALTDDANLFELGMKSLTATQLMLALEESFDIEFPDALLSREHFSSIAAIERAIAAAQLAAPGEAEAR